MRDPPRKRQVVLESRGVDDAVRVEHGDVGVHPGLEPTLAPRLVRHPLQALRRHDRDPGEALHERHEPFVPHIPAQEARKGAGAPRMRPRRVRHPVRGDHHEVARERLADPLVLHHVDDDRAALGPVLLESLLGQPLSGVLPLQVAVADPEALLPAGIEEGGLEAGGRRRVGVGLGRDVEAAAAHAADQVQDRADAPEAGTVHVHDVQRRAGRDRVGEHLLHGGDPHVAHMCVDGDALVGRELEDFEDLFETGARVVLVRHADSEGAVSEAACERVAEGRVVFELDWVVACGRTHGPELAEGAGGVAFEHCEGLLYGIGPAGHRARPHRHVRHGGAEVQDRALAPPGKPGRRQRDTAFKLQRGGDPVPGLELVGAVGLPVRVKVDEAGRDYEAGYVEHDLAGEGVLGYRGDLPVADADMANRVEARFGVHDAPARQHDVVEVLGEDCGRGQGGREEDGGEGEEGGGAGSRQDGPVPWLMCVQKVVPLCWWCQCNCRGTRQWAS